MGRKGAKVKSSDRLLRDTRGVRYGSCASKGAIKVEKVGEIRRDSALLELNKGEHESSDIAYLLERGLFREITTANFSQIRSAVKLSAPFSVDTAIS